MAIINTSMNWIFAEDPAAAKAAYDKRQAEIAAFGGDFQIMTAQQPDPTILKTSALGGNLFQGVDFAAPAPKGMPAFESPSYQAPEPTSPRTYAQPVENLGTIQLMQMQPDTPMDTTIQAAQFFVSEFAAITIALDAIAREAAKYPTDTAAALAHSQGVLRGFVAVMTRYNQRGIAFDNTIVQVSTAMEAAARQLTAMREREAAAMAAVKANHAERDRLTAQAQPATRDEAYELQAAIRGYHNAGLDALKEAARVNQLIASLSSVAVAYLASWVEASAANKAAVRSAKELYQEVRILHNYVSNQVLGDAAVRNIELDQKTVKLVGDTIDNQGAIIDAMEKLADQDKGIIDKILDFFGGAAEGAAVGGALLIGGGLLLYMLSKKKR